MKEQNFKNHKSLVLGYHYISFFSIVALLIGSIVYLIQNLNYQLFLSLLLVVGSFSLLIVWHFTRAFAAKAQDRAIKVEENFRHYLITGKPLSDNLTTLQIVGLRFTSDDEFVELAKKAEKENLSQLEIKEAIKKWKPNIYRL
ncbi:DUF6526 family protein [Flavobacteriales bacterium]|nr:DUF6526 family protein [Flavobacteriales bacterium]